MIPPRGNVLGVRVHALDLPRTLEILGSWIAERQPAYVSMVPAHSILDARRDPAHREVLNRSGLVTPDGMSIVWLLRLTGHRVSRVYGPDLMQAACERSIETGWSHYFYGGAPGVAEALAARMSERYPGLAVAGTWSPPFRPLTPSEDETACERIRASGADIVWVGLGSPAQERWMAEHRGRVGAPVLIGVGAAFDFLSGNKPQAPPAVRALGLEWLFRLISEPRRLWRRYAAYPLFVLLALAQLARLKRYD